MSTSSKGRSYEWEARDKLRSLGYTVLRSAASKGPFDLVFWNASKIAFCQLKAGRLSCAAAERLADALPRPYGASVGVTHVCPGNNGKRGCKQPGHVAERFCSHIRYPDVRRE